MNISAYDIGTLNWIMIIIKRVKWKICWYIYIYIPSSYEGYLWQPWMNGVDEEGKKIVELTWLESWECWVVNEWMMKMVDNNYLWPPQIEKDNQLDHFFFSFLWQLTKTVFWFTFTLLYGFHQPSLCKVLSFTASN